MQTPEREGEGCKLDFLRRKKVCQAKNRFVQNQPLLRKFWFTSRFYFPKPTRVMNTFFAFALFSTHLISEFSRILIKKTSLETQRHLRHSCVNFFWGGQMLKGFFNIFFFLIFLKYQRLSKIRKVIFQLN